MTLHRFDSGANDASRTLLHRAVIDALRPLLRTEGYYLFEVFGIPAPIRFGDEDDEALLDQLLQGQSPVVGVALGRRQFHGRSSDEREWSGEIQVHVYVIVRHQHDLMSPVVGDAASATNVTQDPGANVVMDHVFDRLAGVPMLVAPSFKTTLRPFSEENALFGQTWAVWEQVYTAHFARDTNPNRDNPNLVTSIEVRHDQRPSADGPEVISLTELL